MNEKAKQIGNQLTHPTKERLRFDLGPDSPHIMETVGGLTKREYFAALILSAIISQGNPNPVLSPIAACNYADLLLEELSLEN
jgi:hypothetical protein